MDEGFLICAGVFALLVVVAALPLSIVALVLALRAVRETKALASRIETRADDRAAAALAAEAAPRPAPPVAAAEPRAAAPPPPVSPAVAAGPPRIEVRAAAPPPPPPPPRPPFIPQAAPAPQPQRTPIRWEEWIGLKGLALAGIVVVLIGAGLFLAYAHERGWLGRLGPHVRVALLVAAGLGFLATGEVFSRKGFRVLARVMTGGGLALEYFAAYTAWGRFHIIPQPAAWTLMTVITAVAILLSVRYASLVVAILSLVGGLAAPILIRPERDPGHVLFLYLIAVNAGVLVLAYFRKWRVLNLLALGGTALNVVVWLYSHYWWGGETATEKLGFIVTYLTILWAMYFALSLVHHLLGRRDPSELDLPITLVNVVGYFTGLYVLLRADHHYVLGPAAAVLGAVYLAEGLAVRRWAPAHLRFVLLQVAQAIGLATLAIPIQLDGVFIPMAWAAEATVLFWLGIRLKDWRLRAVGFLVHAASVVALVYYAQEAWNTKGMLVLNARTATFAAVALAMALSAWLYRRLAEKHPAERAAVAATAAVAHVLLMVLVGVEVFRWHADARTALAARIPADLPLQMRDLAWTRDAILAVGLAIYGVLAAALVAILRRAFHHAMALAAFAATFVVIAIAQYHPPRPEFLLGWNAVGATFAAVAACLAVAAVISRYATRGTPGGRPMAIAYELLAAGVVLGLYLTEVGRANSHMKASLDAALSEQSLKSLFAAGTAVMAGLLVLRGLWIRSPAHRVVGLGALAAAAGILAVAAVGSSHVYETVLWQPRGMAFVLMAAVMALIIAGYARAAPRATPEREHVGTVLAIVVHVVVLACFTLEAEDFWASRAQAWFPNEELHAWYARHATLSVGYALYALVLLAGGIRRRSRLLRVLALVILGGTLAKVMLLDLSRLEAIWRILSFVGLGLLLLAASLLYHKYRRIIFPAEAPPAGAKESSDEKA
jgi:uncharacterized membrane protein